MYNTLRESTCYLLQRERLHFMHCVTLYVAVHSQKTHYIQFNHFQCHYIIIISQCFFWRNVDCTVTGNIEKVCPWFVWWSFNNISVISWRSVLLGEETGGPEENHRPVASHWQTLSHNVVHLVLTEIQTHNISGDRHW